MRFQLLVITLVAGVQVELTASGDANLRAHTPQAGSLTQELRSSLYSSLQQRRQENSVLDGAMWTTAAQQEARENENKQVVGLVVGEQRIYDSDAANTISKEKTDTSRATATNKKAVQSAETDVQSTSTKVKSDLDSAVATTGLAVDAAGRDVIPNAAKAAKTDAAGQKEIDALVKKFEADLLSAQKKQQKASDDVAKKQEKAGESEESLLEKRAAADKKALDAARKKFEREVTGKAKEEDKAHAQQEDEAETIAEVIGASGEHAAESANQAEVDQGLTEKALDDLSSAEDGATEGQETDKENFEEKVEEKYDGLEVQSAEVFSDEGQTIEGQIREVAASNAAMTTGAEQALVGFDELAKGDQDKINSMFSEEEAVLERQKEQAAKKKAEVEHEASETDEAIDQVDAQSKESIAGFAEESNNGIQSMVSAVTAGINTMGDDLTNSVAKAAEAAKSKASSVDREVQQFSADGATKVQEEFDESDARAAQEMQVVISKIDAVQGKVDADKREVRTDAQKLTSIEDGIAGMSDYEFAAEAAAKAAHSQNEADLEAHMERLQRFNEVNKGDVDKQIASIHKSIIGARKDIGAAVMKQAEYVTGSTNTALDKNEKVIKDVSGVLQKVSGEEATSKNIADKATTDLVDVTQFEASVKGHMLEDLGALKGRTSEEGGEILTAAEQVSMKDKANAQEWFLKAKTDAAAEIVAAASDATVKTEEAGEAVKAQDEAQGLKHTDQTNKIISLGKKINEAELKFHSHDEANGEKFQAVGAHVQVLHTKVDDAMVAAGMTRAEIEKATAHATGNAIEKLAQGEEASVTEVVARAAKASEGLETTVADTMRQSAQEEQRINEQVGVEILQASGEYKQMLAHVRALAASEQGVTGAGAIEKAKAAIESMVAGKSKLSAAAAKAAEEFMTAQDGAVQVISDYSTDAAARTGHESTAQDEKIAELLARYKAQGIDLKQVVDGYNGKVHVMTSKVGADQEMLTAKVKQAANQVVETEDEEEAKMKALDAEVGQKNSKDLAKIDDMSLEAQRKQLAEQQETAQVNRGLNDENRAVDSMTAAMAHEVSKLMAKNDPTQRMAASFQAIGEIGALMKHASSAEQDNVQQVENQVKVTSNKIEQILAEAGVQGGNLQSAVQSVGLDVSTELGKLKSKFADSQDELKALTKLTLSTAEDLQNAHERRVTKLQKTMAGTRAQLDKALGFSKYTKGEQLDKVMWVLEKALKVDKGLADERDTVLLPSTKTWREQVARIFAALGMELNEESIMRMAAQSMAAEEASNGSLMSAKNALEDKIGRLQKSMSLEIEKLEEDLQRQIDLINANTEMSEQQKADMISQLQQKCRQDISKLKAETQRLIAAQHMSSSKINDEINELNGLLERAKLIAGKGTVESAAWARDMMKQVQQQLDKLRRRYVEAGGMSHEDESFMELSADPRHLPSAVARAAAFIQASDELSSISQERRSKDMHWMKALDKWEQELGGGAAPESQLVSELVKGAGAKSH